MLNLIEKLSLLDVANGEATWKLIHIPRSHLSPRTYPVVVPLNSGEIAILGGDSGVNDECLSDVVLFNTKSEQCKKVAGEGTFEFKSLSNQSARFGYKKVIALVCNEY